MKFELFPSSGQHVLTSKSQSRSWKAVELGMMEVSWPLSTVPTREKVRWRMWLLSSERFFFSSIASSCKGGGRSQRVNATWRRVAVNML